MAMRKHLKLMTIAGIALIFGLIFGWVLLPATVNFLLKKLMALSARTDVRKMWEVIPFALDFKVYLFNYTNPEEIAKGAKPIVREIGPYHFEEWKEKVDIEDDKPADIVHYKRLDKFIFNKELSNGLTGDEIFTIPNIFLVAMVIVVEKDKPAMLNLIQKAINPIFKTDNIFVKVSAMDLLFNGMNINCSQTEFAPKALCTALKKESADKLVFGPNNQYKFSLFGMRNNTVNPDVVTVNRGVKNVLQVGRVLAIDGKPEMEIWRDECNQYGGTDGTVFPPFFNEKKVMESYSFDLCRTFRPRYQNKTSYAGIHTLRYVTEIGDLANDPQLNCYCEAPDKCPPKGTMDLSPCMGAPLLVSLPHYYDTDPALLEAVEGLHPNEEEHRIYIDLEPKSGTTMLVKQRVMFSIQLKKIPKMELFKELPGTYAPLFWIEEGLALNKTFVRMLKVQLFIPLRLGRVVRWLLVCSGCIGLVLTFMYHYKHIIINFAVRSSPPSAKVNPDAEEKKDISVIGQTQPPEIATKIA